MYTVHVRLQYCLFWWLGWWCLHLSCRWHLQHHTKQPTCQPQNILMELWGQGYPGRDAELLLQEHNSKQAGICNIVQLMYWRDSQEHRQLGTRCNEEAWCIVDALFLLCKAIELFTWCQLVRHTPHQDLNSEQSSLMACPVQYSDSPAVVPSLAAVEFNELKKAGGLIAARQPTETASQVMVKETCWMEPNVSKSNWNLSPCNYSQSFPSYEYCYKGDLLSRIRLYYQDWIIMSVAHEVVRCNIVRNSVNIDLLEVKCNLGRSKCWSIKAQACLKSLCTKFMSEAKLAFGGFFLRLTGLIALLTTASGIKLWRRPSRRLGAKW